MRTISFYSYKGGTGRTLLVANIGVYAARLGLSVVMVDHDLEAPGLAYKFMTTPESKPGVLEWLSGGRQPEITDMVQEIPLTWRFNEGGRLQLIGAGPPPSNAYLRGVRMLQSTIFADDGRQGVAGMLTLQETIRRELNPDLLLLDARTGITNTNAITTRVLADDVVALTINSPEQLEGTRAVLRTLPRNKPRQQQGQLGLHVIVSRVQEPERGVQDNEISPRDDAIADEVRRFLTVPAEDLTQTLMLPEVLLLHNDVYLAERESVYLAAEGPPKRGGPLHFDYLRVARRLLGADLVEPAIRAAFNEVVDDARRQSMAGYLGRADLIIEAKAPRTVSTVRPQKTGSLAELRTKVRLLQRAEKTDSELRPELAAALLEQAWAILDSDPGSGPTALQSMRTAERLYERLRFDFPDRYLPAYVATLIQHSRMGTELGATGLAVTKAIEAVDIVTGEPGLTLVPAELRAIAILRLAETRRLTDRELAIDGAEAALEILEALSPSRGADRDFLMLLAMSHQLVAELLLDRDELDSAFHVANDALRIYTQIVDAAADDDRNDIEANAGRATALGMISTIHRICGEYDPAIQAATEAVELLRILATDVPLRYLAQFAHALLLLSRCEADSGAHQRAMRSAENSVHFWGDLLEVDDSIANQQGLAEALNHLAAVAITTEDYERSIAMSRRSITQAAEIEDTGNLTREQEVSVWGLTARAWENLSQASRLRGYVKDAAEAANKATSLYSKIGPSADIQRATVMMDHARLLTDAGKFTEGRAVATEALSVRRNSDSTDSAFIAAAELFIARTYMPKEPAKAKPLAEHVRDQFIALNDNVGLARANDLLAQIYSALGDDQSATDAWREATWRRGQAIDPPND
ncbi:KGGVGR-motif variant AAA ATPase [Mycobacteroides abscessus]|uniref:KGGVGR-motif variant AAA ATPase n=1 Tax=Mycobacteroides abscessus TaxID=36809 RepID=UPI001786327F|nr:hypothetical protein [Mycobacteroides abscessus]MBE5459422.1 hypothetical protein [Mycobacteroides abscessus]QOF44131.1 hypothetical protein E3G69_003180 [Mycobacteroides abscessus]QOF48830.1 hypothetical protein E3G70_003179 [Mycobacteroides abscessus]